MKAIHSRGIVGDGRIAVDWNRVDQLTTNVVLTEDDGQELTDELLSGARPAREVLSEVFPPNVTEALLKKPGRPKSENPKEQVTLRLSPAVLAYFRSQGKGWQTKIDDVLKKHVMS